MDNIFSMLRDPAARTVLAVLGLLAAVVTFLVGQWWWKRKALSYAVSKTRILRIHEAAKDRVQITFDGNRVEAVSLVLVTISNSGHESIKADDFSGSMRLFLGETAQILSFEVVEPHPIDLTPEVRADGNTLTLEPLLLNRGDTFQVKALVNNVGSVNLVGRIVGVRSIAKGIYDRSSVAGMLVSFLGLALVIFGEFQKPRPSPPSSPYAIPMMTAGAVLLYGGTLYAMRSRFRRTLAILLKRDRG